MSETRICKRDGCNGEVFAGGECAEHVRQYRERVAQKQAESAEIDRLRTDNEKLRCLNAQWKDENEELRLILGRMLDEFAASLNSGKAVGYTAGSMVRALGVIREAEAYTPR